MTFLYKLLDETTTKLAKNGLISLSRPIFEFKNTEGKIIDFVKEINKKYKKSVLNAEPSPADFKEIKVWIEQYKSSYGPDWRDEDLKSEIMIFFATYMQTYCGYFTAINLFDPNNLKSFLKENRLRNKVSVLKIDCSPLNKINHWQTNDLNKPFRLFSGASNYLQGYNGFSEIKEVTYNQKFTCLSELLSEFNSKGFRTFCDRFIYLPTQFDWQSEIRLFLRLRSLRKNSSTLACPHAYCKFDNNETISNEELVYYNVIDAIHYYRNSPKYLQLDIGDQYMSIKSISDILKT